MNAAERHAAEIIRNIRPFGAELIYPPAIRAKGDPVHRWITAIWRTSGGNYEIHGTAGTRIYMFYGKREAIRAYNQEARKA